MSLSHLSDLEIANQSTLKRINEIAEKVGITNEALEPYGHFRGKVDITKLKDKTEKGKVVLVTALSPTPAGEGKSTVTVGLADALNQLNEKVMVALREPSLGPVFGMKGGATGEVTLKYSQWKKLICILMVTYMLLQLLIMHYLLL